MAAITPRTEPDIFAFAVAVVAVIVVVVVVASAAFGVFARLPQRKTAILRVGACVETWEEGKNPEAQLVWFCADLLCLEKGSRISLSRRIKIRKGVGQPA